MSEDILENINKTLEDIRTILYITNSEKLEKIKKEFLEEKSEQVKIYKLCTETTTEQIAKK